MSLPRIVVLSVFLLAGCTASPPDGAESPVPHDAVIVVGDFANPPFSSRDDRGKAVGLEVDLLEEVGRSLGRPIVWRERPFAEMLPSVGSGEAHIAASTVGITEERAKSVEFSLPYHRTEIAVLVRAGDSGPRSLADLDGRSVGAGRATTSEEAVRRLLPGAALVVDRPDDTTFDEMLLRGTIDALVLDRPAAERKVREHPVALRRLKEHLGEERYAFAVNPAEPEVLSAIDSVVQAWREDGRLESWARDHGLSQD